MMIILVVYNFPPIEKDLWLSAVITF